MRLGNMREGVHGNYYSCNNFQYGCGVVELVKRLLWTPKVSGSNPREAHTFSKHLEYFSASLSQVWIQHDELG